MNLAIAILVCFGFLHFKETIIMPSFVLQIFFRTTECHLMLLRWNLDLGIYLVIMNLVSLEHIHDSFRAQ